MLVISMFIAMNRFKIVLGKEENFEKVWRDRDTHLKGVPGFKNFNLIKGNKFEDHTLYASHSIWETKDHFINWTKSEAFRLAHKMLVYIKIFISELLTLRVLKLLFNDN